MKKLKWLCCLLFVMLQTEVFCQQAKSPEMADLMRSNGKIYIVVAVCLTILIGLFLYVMRIDRRISALEKETPRT